MQKFKEAVNSSFDPALSFRKDKRWFNPVPVRVMDEATCNLIQVDDVYSAINFTKTQLGDFVLQRSLRQPLTDALLITGKQKSLDELRSDRGLRERITRFVDGTVDDEKLLHNLFTGDYSTSWLGSPNLYKVYRGSRKLLLHLANGLKDITPESDYLKVLVDNFTDLRQDEVYDFIRGPVYKTFKGIRRPEDVGKRWPEPFIEFKATDFKPIRLMVAGLPLTGFIGGSALMAVDPAFFGLTIGSEMMMMFWTPMALTLGRRFDNKNFVEPLRGLYFSNPKVVNAVESLGKIDELLSLAAYADSLKVPVTLPQVVNAERHFFEARGLRNPVLAKKDPAYVENDVNLNGAGLTFLTGPNSGGKTSLSKTILQTQILAQTGSYIPAEQARIAVADGIYYHSPMVNKLQDEEGRFGVEIARTAEIYYKATPSSVIVLDELIEATTYEEKIQISREILEDFWKIGGNTVLVTHNHELVECFRDQGLGQYWQVEFKGDGPTHKIIPGISTDSHADKVMERIGFTRGDRQRYLQEKGYI
ncbi:DNA mismatch repair protein MutS [Candidatus Daviesbacteria bacterium]|nr:DNA mismatch repair protein MutS [Candidatus Daviesbacteria bacterium]